MNEPQETDSMHLGKMLTTSMCSGAVKNWLALFCKRLEALYAVLCCQDLHI